MGRNRRYRQVVSATDTLWVVLLCLGTTDLCWVENGAFVPAVAQLQREGKSRELQEAGVGSGVEWDRA